MRKKGRQFTSVDAKKTKTRNKKQKSWESDGRGSTDLTCGESGKTKKGTRYPLGE